jgi:hypothetical protein
MLLRNVGMQPKKRQLQNNYIIFAQSTRVTDMQGAVSRKYKIRLFTQQNKTTRHILHLFISDDSQYSTLQILFFPFKSQIIYQISLIHDNSSIKILITIIKYNTSMFTLYEVDNSDIPR